MLKASLLCSLALALSGAALTACSDGASDGAGGAGGAAVDPYADVVFEGGATRAGLTALLAVEPGQNLDLAAYMTAPADGEAQSASAPPTFRWRVGPMTALQDRGAPDPAFDDRAGRAWSGGQLGLPLRGFAPSPARELAALLGPPRVAHATEAPMSGGGYLFLILDGRGTELYRAFTTGLEHTPSLERWSALAGEEGPFEACVIDATFADDAIAPNGGPWDGPWIAFLINP